MKEEKVMLDFIKIKYLLDIGKRMRDKKQTGRKYL
jgi:hypothetical protein